MGQLDFPEHMLIIGKTGSGKSMLLAEILVRNRELYDRKTSENIAIVVSPHQECELQRHVGGRAAWDIHHFTMQNFDEAAAARVMQYLSDRGYLGKEVMLLIDDIAFRAQFASKTAEALVGLYTTLRHKNISVVSTMQLHHPNFYDLMSNSGYVVVMNALGQRKILSNILRYYIQQRQVPDLVEEVYARCGGHDVGDYIGVCLSHRANDSDKYTIVSDIFDPKSGMSRKELEI